MVYSDNQLHAMCQRAALSDLSFGGGAAVKLHRLIRNQLAQWLICFFFLFDARFKKWKVKEEVYLLNRIFPEDSLCVNMLVN